MSTGVSHECVEQGDEDDLYEEVWELPQDFNLFSKHEVRRIYFPSKMNTSNGEVDGIGYCEGYGICSHSFQVECLEPSSPLDITNKSESDAEKYDATGHCVWTGAFLLIQCMAEILEIVPTKNKRIIELGCGTGIGGLAVYFASRDAKPQTVCFTDADPAALDVCRRNAELNGLEQSTDYSIQEVTWGEGDISKTTEFFDVVLATDVLYEVDLCDPLFTTVSQCTQVGATFILSHVPRACYNEGNPPEAVENLDQYIIGKAKYHGLYLEKTIQPPNPEDLDMEVLSWCTKDSFKGSSVWIFRRLDDVNLE